MEKDKQSINSEIKKLPSNALDALISGDVELESIKNINKTILDNMECKYTARDVATITVKMYSIHLTEDEIIQTANKNKLLTNKYIAIKIKNTIQFSSVGITALLPFLIRRFAINPKVQPDDFVKSLQQMKEGKLEHV